MQYAIFFVIVIVVACIIFSFISYFGRKLYYESKSVFSKKIGDMVWINDLHFWPLLVICLVLLIGTPCVYEFSNFFNWFGQEYMIAISKDDSKPVKLEKINWYGNFHDSSDNVMWFIKPGESDLKSKTEKTFTIKDLAKNKIIRIRIALFGSYPGLVRDVNDTFRMHVDDGCELDERLIFNNLSYVFNNAEIPIEQLPENAERLCNDWLSRNKIFSVKARFVSVNNVPNPERSVYVE